MSTRSGFLVLLALAAPLRGDNFVNNPGFDADLAHWTLAGGSWNAADAAGDPGSGSAYLELPGHTGNSLQSSCFPVGGGQRLVFGAAVNLEGSDPYAGRVGAVLRFYSAPACAGAHEQTAYPALIAESAYAGWGATQATAIAPATANSARLVLWLNADTDEPQSFRVDDAFVSDGSCARTATTLCLGNDRFRATARWTTPDGARGYAGIRQLSPDSGYLWFFDAANLEVVLKVLDGCGVNDRFWVFASGLTNLGVDLDVVDTLTNASWSFDNDLDSAFPPAQDIEAFATCP